MLELISEDGAFLTLVKPQFEAAPDEVGEGGIVRDPAVHRRVLLESVELFAASGLTPLDVCSSPIKGAKGNREFFLLGARGARDAHGLCSDPGALDAHVAALASKVASL